ncbi:hypothetical protein [Planotetraspora sp. GP83]|uniref:hypothetical protein n=1 Tax=Planotetraspora sp. GP83 TaxID=3156264 RepID=UPI00351281EF
MTARHTARPTRAEVTRETEYFHPVFFSNAVSVAFCRPDGLTRRTTSRTPPLPARALTPVNSATRACSCTLPAWHSAASQTVSGNTPIAASFTSATFQPTVNRTVRRAVFSLAKRSSKS